MSLARRIPLSIAALVLCASASAQQYPERPVTVEVVGNSPDEFNRFLNEEPSRWKQVIDAGGIRQSD